MPRHGKRTRSELRRDIRLLVDGKYARTCLSASTLARALLTLQEGPDGWTPRDLYDLREAENAPDLRRAIADEVGFDYDRAVSQGFAFNRDELLDLEDDLSSTIHGPGLSGFEPVGGSV